MELLGLSQLPLLLNAECALVLLLLEEWRPSFGCILERRNGIVASGGRQESSTRCSIPCNLRGRKNCSLHDDRCLCCLLLVF